MATFLQRIGRAPASKALQVESLDHELRASLWNALILTFWDYAQQFPDDYTASGRNGLHVEATIERLWTSHLKLPRDRIPGRPMVGNGNSVYGVFREIVLDGPWDKALDLVDALVTYAPPSWRAPMTRALNEALSRESAGYRFVSNELTSITSPIEIEAIESAIASGSKAARSHLEAALAMLSDRQNPDFRNSIKESISAVEAACQTLAGRPSATLNDCLKAIKRSKELHPAFEAALVRLYGYTSDAAGIRHALTEDGPDATAADAKFMLVSCAAFCNYLWTVAAESGIKV